MLPRNMARGFVSQEVAGRTHQKVSVMYFFFFFFAETQKGSSKLISQAKQMNPVMRN